MAPGMAQRIIGIRPGEKLHELMISRDDSLHTLEFPDHYVICPAIRFIEDRQYTHNALAEQGKLATEGFKYSSDLNPHFLDIGEIARINAAL